MRRPSRKDATYARSCTICSNVCSEVCQSEVPVYQNHRFNGFPSKIPETVNAWRSELQSKGRSKLASAVASPTEHDGLFEEGWADAVERESSVG
jgi:hypothetical protein